MLENKKSPLEEATEFLQNNPHHIQVSEIPRDENGNLLFNPVGLEDIKK